MRILITGINGFVGTYLKRFLENKSYDVFGIDRHTEKKSIFKVDITQREKVFRVIKKIKPIKIFHLASQSSVQKSIRFPNLTERVNVIGTKNLFDACINAKIEPKILIVSSSEVYGNPKKSPIKEDAELMPLNNYAQSKVKQEKLSMDYFKEYGLNMIISRSFNHTGPGQMPGFVCSNFAKQIADIEKSNKTNKKSRTSVIKVGNLDISRDFSDVRDMVVAYDLALDKCKFGEVYNICSSKFYKISYILDTLLQMSNIPIGIKVEKKRFRKHNDPCIYGDNSKFCRQTKWIPKISLEKTLKDLLNFWRENRTN